MCTLSVPNNYSPGILATAVRQLKEIKGMQIENEVQVSLFAVDTISYMKELKNITRKLLKVDKHF